MVRVSLGIAGSPFHGPLAKALFHSKKELIETEAALEEFAAPGNRHTVTA